MRAPSCIRLANGAGIVAGACLPVVCVQAQTLAGSAHYSLSTSTLDAGGGRGVSNRYALNSSAMAGAVGASGAYTAITGFAGQLFEPLATTPVPVGIALRASPAFLNEDGTRLVSADLLYADGSWAPLSGSLITWSVISGPLSGVDSAGYAAGSPVYQDTVSLVRGQYLTFSATLQLTVFNNLPDNFGAYAGDGLPDDWQFAHFGLNNPDAAPLADPDGDGFNNRFEYDAQLGPADRFSTLRMFITGASSEVRYVSFYPVFAGSAYVLQGSSDLMNWQPVTGDVTDDGSLRRILDDTPSAWRRYYKLEVSRLP